MNDTKKILLYRIDKQAKNVTFVFTEDNEEVWKNITVDMQTVLSFDEICRELTAFCNNSSENSTDFFTRYCSDTLGNLNEAVNKYSENVCEAVKIMSDVRDLNSEGSMKAFKHHYEEIFIRGNGRNDMYTIADTALDNFFYDFSFAILEMKLYVCDCKYCGKWFLGIKNAICCDSEECQALHRRDTKNEKRRAKAKAPYEVHITKLTSYLSQHTSSLKAAVQEDMEYVDKFKARNSEFKRRMREEIERCRAEDITPGKEQDKLLKNLEDDIADYQAQIEAEWKARSERS